MKPDAAKWLERIHKLPLPARVRIMNVCGGHERSITMAGLRKALPKQVELIPGPGCPVCICPEEDVYEAIQLALNENIILVAFGDMLRVPVNAPKREARTLEQAKAQGADIRPVASPLDVVHIAQTEPDKQVVFFAAGFETTTAPVAAMLAEGVPENLSVLLSGRLTWPAVAMLLDTGEARFDALIAPGHVATIMGPEEWQFVVDKHQLPAAIAGFTPESLLAAMYSVLRQFSEQNIFLDNCLPRNSLNPEVTVLHKNSCNIPSMSLQLIGVASAVSRIPVFTLNKQYQAQDTRQQFPSYANESRKRIGEMPPGCDCANVVLGKIYPNQCRLYGTGCHPRHPIGPCMVSDEGACRIWWAGGVREPAITKQTESGTRASAP